MAKSTQLETRRPAAIERPPAVHTGLLRWLHQNLFSSWFNSCLTVVAILFLAKVVPPLVHWFVVDAVWTAADPAACKEASGACWAMIHEKYRLILFGRYPYEQQWRPLLGLLVLAAVIGVSCNRNFWKPWLADVWIGGLVVWFVLMWGGVLGLPFVPNNLWGGLPLTLLLTVIGLAVAFPVSILLALGRRSHMPVIRVISVGYIELIRGVPLISLLFMASFMLPLFLPTGASIDEVLRAQVAIIMFSAAYLAEAVRGGLQAIPHGQYEAAHALGLTYWQTQRKIILPQAIKIAIPSIVNIFIGLFKDTSLVAIVSLTDLLLSMRQAIADPLWRRFFVEGYIFIALIYFCVCFFMSKYSQYLEAQFDTRHSR
jgi:general L-amino acid transport system permease protein